MSSLEALRNKLHLVWESGSPDEILLVSQELDVEIVKYMKNSIAKSQEQLLKEQEKAAITPKDKSGVIQMPKRYKKNNSREAS